MVDDDLEPLITRCPNCGTQFRVTENQLAVASGRVRCGACLTVFQGIDHLILDEEEGFSTGTEADAALDALLDELEPVASGAVGGADVGQLAENTAPETRVDAELPEAAMEAPSQLYGGFEEEAEAGLGPEAGDDLSSDAALKELAAYAADLESKSEAEAQQVEAPDSTDEVWDTAVEPKAPADPALPAESGALAMAGVEADAGEGSAEPLDREDASPMVSETEATRPEPDEDWLNEDYEKWIEPRDESLEQMVDEVVAAPVVVPSESAMAAASTEPVAAAEGGAAGADTSEGAPTPDAVADSGLSSAEKPAQFGEVSFAREPVRLWAAALAAGLAVLLALQIVYLQLPDWSRDPGWRGFYEGFCGLFGCELPELRAVDALRTRNLVVRSHPELADVLVVDVMIVNQAPFAQRYPDLELRFAAVSGVLVAGRSFTPEEYLAGEARATDLMPPQTPVQVSLEILDPGEDAVNYTLSFN
ncbi:MAG: DUF3426 domain-containing protein [Pseudomonadota bacterium]